MFFNKLIRCSAGSLGPREVTWHLRGKSRRPWFCRRQRLGLACSDHGSSNFWCNPARRSMRQRSIEPPPAMAADTAHLPLATRHACASNMHNADSGPPTHRDLAGKTANTGLRRSTLPNSRSARREKKASSLPRNCICCLGRSFVGIVAQLTLLSQLQECW
jgi:hypothetical protein